VNRTIDHLDSLTTLEIPDIPELFEEGASPEGLAERPEVVSGLESIVMGWEKYIDAVIETYSSKVTCKLTKKRA